MKFLIVFLTLSYASSTLSISKSTDLSLADPNDEELKLLINLDQEGVSSYIKNLTNLHKATNGNSHWCCVAGGDEVPTVQRTKISYHLITVATKVKVGYTSCGFGGWSKCTLYSTRYKQVPQYFIDVYDAPDPRPCPELQIKCCKDHIEVAGNCLELFLISQHISTFCKLVHLGLIQINSGLDEGQHTAVLNALNSVPLDKCHTLTENLSGGGIVDCPSCGGGSGGLSGAGLDAMNELNAILAGLNGKK